MPLPLLATLLVGSAAAAPSLVVLGVAQDGGHPQAGCTRSCCREAWTDPARRHRVTSLALVDPETHRRWLLDASPDLPEQLAVLDQIAPRTGGPMLDGIFLTHGHIGHYTGLVHLGREVMGTRSVPVWAMPRMAAFLTDNAPWGQLVSLGNISLQALDQPVALGPSLTVTPLLVPHRGEYTETVGYLIRGPQKSALYLPDIDAWERWDHSLAEVLAGVDIAWLDATFYDNTELPGARLSEVPHPRVVDTLALVASLPASERAKVHFIHMNHTNPLLDPTSVAFAAVLAAGAHVAAQGDRFDL